MYKREKVQLKDCSARMTLNIRNLTKLIETCSKIYWTKMKERLDDYIQINDIDNPEKLEEKKEMRETQKKSMAKNPRTSLEALLEKL